MIVADIVRRALSVHASRRAVFDDTRALTYGEVGARAHRLVNALDDRGIERGDRVATLAPNDLTSLEFVLGLALGGYVRTALHAMGSGDAHRRVLDAAGARVLITTTEFYRHYSEALAAVASIDLLIVQGARAAGLEEPVLDYDELLASSEPGDRRLPVAGDDILHLAYSSGSSGLPRASVHTQASWAVVTADTAAFLPRVTEEDIYLAAAPLTHAASTVLYLLVARGAAIRIMDHFDADQVVAAIEADRCTMTFVVPTMLQAIVSAPTLPAADFSSLRAVVYASAPISIETALAAQRALGNVLFQSYGQSECLPATTLTPEDHARGAAGDERILRSAGRVCLNADVRIVGDDGTILEPGEIGEILVRTGGRMREIYGDPFSTAARITADGFVRTNDIGHLDDDGLLFVVDRKDDMIISGGFNIWPAEIENVLLRHHAVIEAAVVGVPHPRWGETPHAVVVVREGASVTEEELLELCRSEIGSMKKPTAFVFRDTILPRTALGKIPRRAIRDTYWPMVSDPHPVSSA